jgi:hypothetical protein
MDPAGCFAEECESSYAPARGPLFFSKEGGGSGRSSIKRANDWLESTLEELDNADKTNRPTETILELRDNIDRWWGWTESDTELQRIAATHLLGVYVTRRDVPRRSEGIESLVDELFDESPTRRIAALFAFDYSIYFLDRDNLIEIGRCLVERGESETLAVWGPDDQKIDVDPSKFVHLRVASSLLGLGALSRDHEDHLVRFYDYIIDAGQTYSMDELGMERESEMPALGDPSEMDFPIDDFSQDEWLRTYTLTPIEDMSTAGEEELYEPLNELIVQDDPYLRLAGYMGLQHVQKHIFSSSASGSTVKFVMMSGLGDDDEMVYDYVEGVVKNMLEVSETSLKTYLGMKRDIKGNEEVDIPEELYEEIDNSFLGIVYDLVDVLKRHNDPNKVRSMADMIRGITKALPVEDHASIVEGLLEFVRSDAAPSERASVVAALLQTAYSKGGPSTPLGINIETIVALSKDEHAEIRAATVDALFQVVDEDVLHKRELGEEEDALDAMIERLEKDENAIVRERVADVKKDYGL